MAIQYDQGRQSKSFQIASEKRFAHCWRIRDELDVNALDGMAGQNVANYENQKHT